MKRNILYAFLALAFGLLSQSESAFAETGERTIRSVAQLRSTNWGAFNVLHVLSYYDGLGKGGGDFLKLSGPCTSTVSGGLTNGSALITNLTGPVYIGEGISSAARFPANTTIASVSFNRVLSAGTWTGSSTTISNVPDTTNIKLGMIANSVRIADGSTVTAITPPSTVINTTGTLNNGKSVVITGSLTGIVPGMFVTMTANADALPKVFPDSAFVPGAITVLSVVGSTVNFTGSLGIAGITGSGAASLRFTSTDGSVTVSTPTTGAISSESGVIFYQKNATASANSNSNNTQTITLNGDNGGMQIVDVAGNCFVRQTPYADILGWGAKDNNTTDSTGPLQNDAIWSGQSTQPGPSSSIVFPPSIGVVKATTLILLKPTPFIGNMWNPAILQQMDGQPTNTPLVYEFPLYDQSNRYTTYMVPEFGYQGVTLRGPNDMATTIGLYADGYNSNVNIPDTPKAVLYMDNFLIDQFKGFGLYVARASGTIGYGTGRVQVRGVGVSNGSNDCIHSDGQGTWSMSQIVTSACDSGLYLNSPSFWTVFRDEAFANNHAVFLTGSLSSGGNNASFDIYDFQYGANLTNAFVIDTNGLRVSCYGCSVPDTGPASSPGVYSDIEITANAAVPSGPVLNLVGNYFTQVHSEAAGQNHLNNITFDSSATATVAIDSVTTTTSPANIIWTNLATCSCTGKMIGATNLSNVFPTFFGLNNNVAPMPATGSSGIVAEFQGPDGQASGFELNSYRNSTNTSPTVTLRNADGTGASPTAMQSGEALGTLSLKPHDGTGFVTNSVARLVGAALENFDGTHHGSAWDIDCTPKASATIGTCLQVQMGGLLPQQTTAPTIAGTGTPVLAARSTDTAGSVTGGTSATSIVVTWAYPKTNAPFCLVASPTGTVFTSYTPSTTALTIALSATTGAQFTYSCWSN